MCAVRKGELEDSNRSQKGKPTTSKRLQSTHRCTRPLVLHFQELLALSLTLTVVWWLLPLPNHSQSTMVHEDVTSGHKSRAGELQLLSDLKQ